MDRIKFELKNEPSRITFDDLLNQSNDRFLKRRGLIKSIAENFRVSIKLCSKFGNGTKRLPHQMWILANRTELDKKELLLNARHT